MADVTFNLYITNEGVAEARETLSNPGWYLIPYQFRISQNRGQINATRTYDSIDTNPWYSEAFSGVTAGTTDNKLIHSVIIPPVIQGQTGERIYGEIYFIYKNHNNEPFLYAIGAPTTSLAWSPGVSQQFYFAFTLNNVNIADTFDIQYTYPQDISDHNTNSDSHELLLKRDGSRAATGILTYDSSKTFTQDNQITNKKYVDDKAVAEASAVRTSLQPDIEAAKNTYKYSSGTFTKKELVVTDTNVSPSSASAHQDAIWLYSAPVYPYVPMSTNISGTSHSFSTGGVVICTSATTVTVSMGQSSLTFNSFVGMLPVTIGASVSTSRTSYFVNY